MEKRKLKVSTEKVTINTVIKICKQIYFKILQILCLHGFRQSKETFKQKLGFLKKMLKSHADFVFMDAPHTLQASNDKLVGNCLSIAKNCLYSMYICTYTIYLKYVIRGEKLVVHWRESGLHF